MAASVVMADPAPHPQPGAGSFATPLTSDMIDPAAAAEWVGGREQPVADLAALRKLLWLRDTSPTGTAPYAYGKSTEPGIRSLRIGFQAELPVGSVMVRGSDQLSVLRSGVPYPGNLGNDAQWIPAQRVLDHQLASAEVPSDGYALWVLPPGTRTRALRFTHTATLTDSSFAGSFGGFYILSARYDNLAPNATITTSANASAAPLLVDLKNNQWWHTWDNGPTFSRPVTTSTPEWITLTWPAPVQISGLAALWAGFNAADTEIFTGPAGAQPASAPAALWQPIGSHYTLRTQYPRWFGIDWLDFGKTVTTRAIRLRITAPTDESHSHLIGKTKNGSRVWLGELMALSPLNTTDLQAAVAATPVVAKPHPPIPVHFTLSAPGYVTLVIDDAKGNRVRNLISDTLFPAGANTAWWDGSDDLSRSPDHAVDSIPTHLVAPGRYTA
ncbi:MAG TPA: hypothetical protein VL346_02945, partial [Acidobacteriaceae bacterium]|nr:hypothetical protein [Acidobacteriaceae bacterium]